MDRQSRHASSSSRIRWNFCWMHTRPVVFCAASQWSYSSCSISVFTVGQSPRSSMNTNHKRSSTSNSSTTNNNSTTSQRSTSKIIRELSSTKSNSTKAKFKSMRRILKWPNRLRKSRSETLEIKKRMEINRTVDARSPIKPLIFERCIIQLLMMQIIS